MRVGWSLLRMSDSVQLAQEFEEARGVTRQRVVAAESVRISEGGRASNAIPHPALAASCRRRVWGSVSPSPSAMTAVGAPHRRARSIAHSRAAALGGSTNTDAASTPSCRASVRGYGNTRRPIQTTRESNPRSKPRHTRSRRGRMGGDQPRSRESPPPANHSWSVRTRRRSPVAAGIVPRPVSRSASRAWIAPTRSRRLLSWSDRFTFGILTQTNLSTTENHLFWSKMLPKSCEDSPWIHWGVVPGAVHECRDPSKGQALGRAGSQQRRYLGPLARRGPAPGLDGVKEDGHAVVDGGHRGVDAGRDDGERLQRGRVLGALSPES